MAEKLKPGYLYGDDYLALLRTLVLCEEKGPTAEDRLIAAILRRAIRDIVYGTSKHHEEYRLDAAKWLIHGGGEGVPASYICERLKVDRTALIYSTGANDIARGE